MDAIAKTLAKLVPKERQALKAIHTQLLRNDLTSLEVQKLQGHTNLYRVRKGNYRIIFQKLPDNTISILTLERRSDTTYRGY